MRGCKRASRPSWADFTDNDDTLAELSDKKVFLACWNMPLHAEILESWRRREDSIDVRTALQLPEADWPGEILDLVLLEVIQTGVPLAFGIPIDKYIGDRFSVTLLLCTGAASLAEDKTMWYCKRDTKEYRADYARAFVMRVALPSNHFSRCFA